jgi:predicted TIM-barrel fold metal-dependent hydrolase
MGFTDEVNAYAADYAKECRGRVIAFGSVHPTRTNDAAGDMDRLIASGIRGVKIHPAHQPCYPNDYRNGNANLETIYRKCQEAGLVLMIHTGTSIFPGARNIYANPIHCDDIGVDFPDLNVILAHGGRPLWMESAMFVVRRQARIDRRQGPVGERLAGARRSRNARERRPIPGAEVPRRPQEEDRLRQRKAALPDLKTICG